MRSSPVKVLPLAGPAHHRKTSRACPGEPKERPPCGPSPGRYAGPEIAVLEAVVRREPSVRNARILDRLRAARSAWRPEAHLSGRLGVRLPAPWSGLAVPGSFGQTLRDSAASGLSAGP